MERAIITHPYPKSDPVHYPEDRRFRIWIVPAARWILLTLILVPVVLAWVQVATLGAPSLPAGYAGTGPLTFPLWLRIAHVLNIVFLLFLMQSGLSIFMDHPRLYWNDHCTPGTEWLRFTPLEVPRDKVWTAKDDARYISPWFGLPGYRHTIGMARHWHFTVAFLWFMNGLAYVSLLFITGQWTRIVPTSWQIIPGAWAVFAKYATFHFPVEAAAAVVGYNPLQQIAYFIVIFVCAPLSFLTGLAMSPAIFNRFPWYGRIFGGRQSARSIHFLLFLGYVVFALAHLAMVAVTGFSTNMNQIVRGVADGSSQGMLWGAVGIGVIALLLWFAHWIAWNHPRIPQLFTQGIHMDFMRRLFFSRLKPFTATQFKESEISPHLWANGKLPTSDEWKDLAANGFRDYRLKICGLVENPVELSLDDLKALKKTDQITMHHCIQGWSGIAHWGGVPLRGVVDLVRPKAEARTVVFRSFDEGLYGGEYYDTQQLENVLHPQCILAYEMNHKPLEALYGAPLRLRVENQLGYKMVKWVKAIEFVESAKEIGKGYGGKNEDDEYFDLVPEI